MNTTSNVSILAILYWLNVSILAILYWLNVLILAILCWLNVSILSCEKGNISDSALIRSDRPLLEHFHF